MENENLDLILIRKEKTNFGIPEVGQDFSIPLM